LTQAQNNFQCVENWYKIEATIHLVVLGDFGQKIRRLVKVSDPHISV